jgi:hypothetical protein
MDENCGCKQVNITMHALIIILLLFVIWKVLRVERLTTDYSDAYLGGGLDNAVYTSGATMRRLGQVFSSTDQGKTNTVYNDQLKSLY